MTGHITVTVAGQKVSGDNKTGSIWYLSAHPENTGTVWIFGADDSEGFPLFSGGVAAIPVRVENLNELRFDSDVSGDKVCYIEAP